MALAGAQQLDAAEKGLRKILLNLLSMSLYYRNIRDKADHLYRYPWGNMKIVGNPR